MLNWLVDKLTELPLSLSKLAQQTTFVMVPPLFLIFLVLGTIFIGIATPTEGGAMGAAGAMLLAAAEAPADLGPHRDRPRNRPPSCPPFVVFILIGARVFSLTFYGVDGHRLGRGHLLTCRCPAVRSAS